MELNIRTEELKNALQLVSGFTGKDMDITKNILLEARDNFLYLAATDTHHSCKTKVEAEIKKEGEVVVHGELTNLVKTIRKREISMHTTPGGKLSVDKNFYLGIVRNGPDKFPKIPLPDKHTQSHTLEVKTFLKEIKTVSFAADKKSTDLTGTIFLSDDLVYATDKKMFAGIENPTNELQFHIPQQAISYFENFEEVELYVEENIIYLLGEKIVITVNLPAVMRPEAVVRGILFEKEPTIKAQYNINEDELDELIYKLRQMRTINDRVTFILDKGTIYIYGSKTSSETVNNAVNKIQIQDYSFKERAVVTFSVSRIYNILRKATTPVINFTGGHKDHNQNGQGFTFIRDGNYRAVIAPLVSNEQRAVEKVGEEYGI